MPFPQWHFDNTITSNLEGEVASFWKENIPLGTSTADGHIKLDLPGSACQLKN